MRRKLIRVNTNIPIGVAGDGVAGDDGVVLCELY
jgi:hypothetical protein